MYRWRGINAYLWVSKGYGYIIELEKMSNEKQKMEAHKRLTKLLESLNIKITPRREFERRFAYYKKNWRKLIRSGPKKPRF